MTDLLFETLDWDQSLNAVATMACGKPVAAMACGDNGLWKACGCMNVRVCVPEPLAPIRENNALNSIEYHTHCDLVSSIILLQQKGARNSGWHACPVSRL